MADILHEGDTSGKIFPVGRLNFLVDAENYFKSFVQMARQAKRFIFISGWTIDSRTGLLINARGTSDLKLSEFLLSLVEENRDLGIYILVWDFVGIYNNHDLLSRKPIFHLPWFAPVDHPIRAMRESAHPIGSVFHQCFVVIDDQVAFIGNTDFTRHEWDTQRHRMDDYRRFDSDQKPYPPVHSLEVMLEGEPAAALGDIFRDRWYNVSGEMLPGLRPWAYPLKWPSGMTPDLTRAEAALALTIPGEPDKPQVCDIERLYIKAIQCAESCIYIEDQYLTSSSILQSLAARLRNEQGPEVVIVTSRKPKTWVVEWAMGYVRDFALDYLERSDLYKRLEIFYPVFKLKAFQPIQVKSNVMIIDDKLIILGSANLNNRSMMLDLECDLALESGDCPAAAKAISRLRSRLLAEHLDSAPEQISRDMENSASVIETIKKHNNKLGRSLAQMPKPVLPDMTKLPDRRVPLENLLCSLVKASEWPQRRKTLLTFFGALLAIIGIMYLWGTLIPEEYLDPDSLLETVGQLAAHPLAPLAVIMVTVLGGAFFVPLTVFILLAGALFDPLTASVAALIGVMANAMLMYAMGLYLKPNYLRRLGGPKAARLSRNLSQNTFWVIFMLRVLPITPIQLVSLASGVARLPVKAYFWGTFCGMVPYTLLLIFLSGQFKGLLSDPTPSRIVFLVAIILALFAGVFFIIRRMERLSRRSRPGLFASDHEDGGNGASCG